MTISLARRAVAGLGAPPCAAVAIEDAAARPSTVLRLTRPASESSTLSFTQGSKLLAHEKMRPRLAIGVRWDQVKAHAGLKDEHEIGSAEQEVTDLISLVGCRARLYGRVDVDGADRRHADG